MCNKACEIFGKTYLGEKQVKGLRVLEVGAYDINGSLRSYVKSFEPASYIGIDLISGKGVDLVCRAEEIVERFGEESFELVICTELLEHVEDWRLVVTNLKRVCTIGGIILLTTRSKGFPRHGAPSDYWRFEVEDMKLIFSDCVDVVIQKDFTKSSMPSGWIVTAPGVFVKAVRVPQIYDLKNIEVSGIE